MYTYTSICIHLYIYMYIYIYMYSSGESSASAVHKMDRAGRTALHAPLRVGEAASTYN